MNNKNDKKETQPTKRPQEPLRPYPYHEEEVTYANKEAGVVLAGTLTMPRGSGPFPAVILIAGTGPHTRDAEMCGHKTMLVLADHLTRQGIAVLRFDKRGCGVSSGSFELATSLDFANDVQAGIQYLKSRKEINAKQIGLIGHSEGGTVASIVIAKSQDVAFVVMLASTGVNGEEVLYEEYILFAQAMGEAEEAITKGHKLLSQMVAIVKKEADIEIARKKIRTLRTEYLEKLSEAQRKSYQTSTLNEFVEFLMSYFHWLRFFLTFEPTTALKMIQVPVLALFCERDLLVPPKQNLLPFRKALEESGNNDCTILQMPELNHRFMHCKIGTEIEYAEIEETMSPEVLKIVSEWIEAKTIKK
jgi:pimeloyl-ACP methyl ester carboxylesterase